MRKGEDSSAKEQGGLIRSAKAMKRFAGRALGKLDRFMNALGEDIDRNAPKDPPLGGYFK